MSQAVCASYRVINQPKSSVIGRADSVYILLHALANANEACRNPKQQYRNLFDTT